MKAWTEITNEHRHTFHVCMDGNGETSNDRDHRHEIKNWKVLSAHGHTHGIDPEVKGRIMGMWKRDQIRTSR